MLFALMVFFFDPIVAMAGWNKTNLFVPFEMVNLTTLCRPGADVC